MTIAYLQEHAQAVRLGEALARKEAEHLRYSLDTLFAMPISLTWVRNLAHEPALAEKVEAFASRFSRLQDQLGKNCCRATQLWWVNRPKLFWIPWLLPKKPGC